jgi:hypothetical protein
MSSGMGPSFRVVLSLHVVLSFHVVLSLRAELPTYGEHLV